MVEGLGLRVKGLEWRVWGGGRESRVEGGWSSVDGLGLRVKDLGLRVEGG